MYVMSLCQTNPGRNGPNPVKLSGSVELETAAIVLPQKLFSQNTILALSLGIFLTSYPHFLAILLAVSPPSTPVKSGHEIASF